MRRAAACEPRRSLHSGWLGFRRLPVLLLVAAVMLAPALLLSRQHRLVSLFFFPLSSWGAWAGHMRQGCRLQPRSQLKHGYGPASAGCVGHMGAYEEEGRCGAAASRSALCTAAAHTGTSYPE
ncbi:hypothetical protein COO60DRAFT_1564478 [Scenedesmus sp. NREL 46B-D3]|nr:hypothetical protein COO60DRAFT_1564478 [Scenedesmus sp. NREL 46B-D3]